MSSKRRSRKNTRPPARQVQETPGAMAESRAPSEQNADELVQQISYSGPLPAPQAFAEYEVTLPGAAREILDMAKNEQKIRERLATRELDSRDRELDIREKALDIRSNATTTMLRVDSKRVNLSFIATLIILAIAGFAAWQGNALIAVPLGIAGVVGSSLVSIIRWGIRWLERRPDSSPQPPPDH